ncbi:NAD-dependent epimerase/dehydratase family protein [Chryseobacterium sp. Alg-005]|uniref:NAD-dependent epimerase/dehydratase family protein n=1 Tax=Chryseobacterium sp. Alg-005 TaxID=3159516 RepID=UPI0035557D1E
MKKVFVTGTTGLLGTHVLIKLLNDGYNVIALVRKKSSDLGTENENLTWVEGDLFTDISGYLDGVDCIIHIAAETRQNLLSYTDYRKINHEAVVHLFSQAVAAKVNRFIFVSSANTLGYGSKEEPGNEKSCQKYPFTHSFYAKSKQEAENYLLQNNRITEVVIVNPSFMIGAYDHKPSSGKIIYWAWKKKIIFYPKGGKNFVHAEDAAKGIINAIEKGKNGEKYLLAHENLSYKDFFKKINRITSQKPLMIPIPDTGLVILGRIGNLLRALQIKTDLSSENMKALRIDNFYSNHKSIQELGLEYQPIDKAVEDAVEYFKKKKN